MRNFNSTIAAQLEFNQMLILFFQAINNYKFLITMKSGLAEKQP